MLTKIYIKKSEFFFLSILKSSFKKSSKKKRFFLYSKICFDITYIWLYHGVTFMWGYRETFFLLAKENEKSEIPKCSLFLLSNKVKS